MNEQDKTAITKMATDDKTPAGQRAMARALLELTTETAAMSQSNGSDAAMAQHVEDGHGHVNGPCLAVGCETCTPVLVSMAQPVTTRAREAMLKDIQAAVTWSGQDVDVVEIYAQWAENGRADAPETQPLNIAGLQFTG